MKLRILLVCCAALALTVGVTVAAAGGPKPGKGGNSANAKKCQKGGWKTLIRSDGSSFKNQGACVSYAAQGGTLTPKSPAQLYCESIGGTFGNTDLTSFEWETIVWTCNGWTSSSASDFNAKVGPLLTLCFGDGGLAVAFTPAVGVFSPWVPRSPPAARCASRNFIDSKGAGS